MKFDKSLHQKVRYEGQLYAVILEEFPDYVKGGKDFKAVLHPIANDWIVQITNPRVREYMVVEKSNVKVVPAHIME